MRPSAFIGNSYSPKAGSAFWLDSQELGVTSLLTSGYWPLDFFCFHLEAA